MNDILGKNKIILDGAMGTRLFAAGLKNGECPERWILSDVNNRAAVEQVQTGYARAGSDVLYTPTFGANRAALSKYSLEENVRDYNLSLAAVTVAVAREHGICAAGDMSSTGLFMQPMGDASFDDIKSIYREQAEYLLEAGVDMFAIETGLSLDETRAAVLAVRELSEKPIIATFTLEKAGRTMSGNTPEALVTVLWSLGVEIAGFNCSQGPCEMKESFRSLAGRLPEGVRLAAKPNAGLPHCGADGETVFDMTCDDFAREMRELVLLGASAVGGCCGTDDSFIRLLAEDKTEPRPVYSDASHFASDGRTVFDVDLSMSVGDPMVCGEQLIDGIMSDCSDILNVRLESPDSAMYLAQAAMYINRPLMLEGDFASLSEALKLYSGRAVLSGSSSLTEDERQKLIKSFNPVIM